MVLPSCALGLGQTFLCPLQEKLPGESCPSQRWKTGCCTSRTCCLQPDPPSPLQNHALRWASACCCSSRLSPVLGRGAGSRVGCPALRCSEGTFPPQDAAVGTCGSSLVDERGTMFKKNPRRVVRPAGESCWGAGGTWVPAWWRGAAAAPWVFGAGGRGWGSLLLEGAAGLCQSCTVLLPPASPPLVQTTPSR